MSSETTPSRVLSIRFPVDVYDSLKAVSVLSSASMNAIVVRAVRRHLLEAGGRDMSALIEKTHARLRATLEKLRAEEEAEAAATAKRPNPRRPGSSA